MNLFSANTCTGWVLAQRDAWESLGNRFTGDHAKLHLGDLWGLLGVLTAGAALVWLLRWLYGRQQARRLSNHPRHLFLDLCRAHRLAKRDRRRLLALAEFHQLPQAGLLFVRPELFAEVNLPDDDTRTVDHYQRLHERLFAGLESPSPTRLAATDPAVEKPAAVVVAPAVGPEVSEPSPVFHP